MSRFRSSSDTVDTVDMVTESPSPGVERLAAALGWEQVPEFSDEELQELDEEFEAAQAEARSFYGLEDTE